MQNLKTAAFWAAFFAFVWGTAAIAEPVSLSSNDNANTLTGELIEFDGDLYRIETKYGVLTVNADSVTCTGDDCPDPKTLTQAIRITGSEGIDDVLMPAMIQAFAERNGYSVRRSTLSDQTVQFELSRKSDKKILGTLHLVPMPTDQAFADLTKGSSDIVLARREMTDTERQAGLDQHTGDFLSTTRSTVFALDAIVPIVPLENMVRSISIPELRRVLEGQITNWSELGGADGPISIALPDETTGLQRITLETLGLETSTPLSESQPGSALTLTPYSKLGRDQLLSLDGSCGYSMQATRRSIKTEDYPLTMPVYLYTPARRLPSLGRQFIAFTKTVAAQTIIRRSGLVDQLPQEIGIDQQGIRFLNAIRVIEPDQGVSVARRMVGVLEGKARLTFSFRFEEGSTQLNGQSKSNVALLAKAIETGMFSGRQMLFVGFSDGVGSGSANLAISQKRAEIVRAAVELTTDKNSLRRVEMGTDAFGEAMPMACDDSELGRHVNRRVEVWVR